MQSNILICGVGGQGIVLTSKLIAATAMEHDIPVMSAETIGMAQKGEQGLFSVCLNASFSRKLIFLLSEDY